jgi:hypothetical protein
MKGFVDTTILIEVAEKRAPTPQQVKAFVAVNGAADVSDYAYRELVAGRLQQICDAHNRVLAAQDPAEAIGAILRQSAFRARSATASATAVAQALSIALQASTSSRGDVKREVQQALQMQAGLLWRRAMRDPAFVGSQPLACFAKGPLTVDPVSGALKGPSGAFNCDKRARCAAAQYMSQDQQGVQRLIDALHPNELGPALAAKQENKSRRKALKDLKQHGPSAFNKRNCRALGDAYFALMCPPGSTVLTTNLVDHDLLCGALNKTARKP